MNYSEIIVPIILIVLCLHEIKLLKTLVIKSKKVTMDIAFLLGGITLLVIVAVLMAKNIYQYSILGFAVLFLFLQFAKQGISNEGLLIIAKYGELYRWDKIKKISLVETSDDLVLICQLPNGFNLGKIHFYKYDKDKIIDILNQNNVNFTCE